MEQDLLSACVTFLSRCHLLISLSMEEEKMFPPSVTHTLLTNITCATGKYVSCLVFLFPVLDNTQNVLPRTEKGLRVRNAPIYSKASIILVLQCY